MLAMVLCGSACSGGKQRGEAVRDSATFEPGSAASQPTAAARKTTGSPGKTILFLGTSLTAGLGLPSELAYPQEIQRKIDAAHLSYTTVNGGVSGETAAGLLRRLDWVLQQPASVIVVETGANDALRGQPVGGTLATIDTILTVIAREQPSARVVLVQMEAPPNLGQSYTRDFHAMFPALAKKHGATLMPFLLQNVAGMPTLNQADGIHPNRVGEQIVATTVWQTLEPLLR